MAGQFTLLRDEIEGCLLLLGKQRLAFLAPVSYTHLNLNFFLRNGMAVTANTPKAIADTTIKTLNAPVLLLSLIHI